MIMARKRCYLPRTGHDHETLAEHWPNLYRAHCERYRVKRTYSLREPTAFLAARGLDVTEYRCQFRSRRTQRMYLGLFACGGRFGFNAAPSCSSVFDASEGVRRGTRPARGELLTGDSAQGVGFVVDGTSTKACRGRGG